MLPQTYSGRESITRLYQMILPASAYIRLVWAGFFQEDSGPTIKLAAVVGRALDEAEYFHLSKDCFDYAVPFAQNVDWNAAQESDLHALFGPWKAHPDSSTVK